MPSLSEDQEIILLDPNDQLGSSISASIHSNIDEAPRVSLDWHTCDNPIERYRRIKKSKVRYYEVNYKFFEVDESWSLGVKDLESTFHHLIFHFVTLTLQNTLSKIYQNDPSSLKDKSSPILSSIDYEETNDLGNIDAYLATNGEKAKLIIKKSLSSEDKLQAIDNLLKRLGNNKNNLPEVYLWRAEE